MIVLLTLSNSSLIEKSKKTKIEQLLNHWKKSFDEAAEIKIEENDDNNLFRVNINSKKINIQQLEQKIATILTNLKLKEVTFKIESLSDEIKNEKTIPENVKATVLRYLPTQEITQENIEKAFIFSIVAGNVIDVDLLAPFIKDINVLVSFSKETMTLPLVAAICNFKNIIPILVKNGANPFQLDNNNISTFEHFVKQPKLWPLIQTLLPNYTLPYEDFIQKVLVPYYDGLDKPQINLIYHALNSILTNNFLLQDKILFLINERGLKIKIDNKFKDLGCRYFPAGNLLVLTQTVVLSNSLKEALLHQFDRAYQHNIHKIRYTHSPNEWKDSSLTEENDYTLPFYPFLRSEMLTYKSLIEKGMERMAYGSKPLVEKRLEGKNLSNDEIQELKALKALTAGYRPQKHHKIFHKQTHKEIFEKISNNPKFLNFTMNGRNLKFYIQSFQLSQNQESILIEGSYTLKPDSKLGRLEAFLGDMLSLENKIIEQGYSHNQIISELHAHIVGQLPKEILDHYFPEVLKYDAADIEQALANLNDIQTKINNLPRIINLKL